jgi:hypothetical protein
MSTAVSVSVFPHYITTVTTVTKNQRYPIQSTLQTHTTRDFRVSPQLVETLFQSW